jgi:hypothetical protein
MSRDSSKAATVSFVTGHVAVPQDAWNRLSKDRLLLNQPSNVPRTERVQNLLDDLDGVCGHHRKHNS